MSLPAVTTPVPSSLHSHSSPFPSPFQWNKGNPAIQTPSHWRLNVGSAPWSWNYHRTAYPWIPGSTQNTTVDLHTVPSPRLLYTFVEYSYNNGTSWTPGDLISFTCKT